MTSLPPYSVLMPLAPWESPEVLSEALLSLANQSLAPDQVVMSCDGAPPTALKAVIGRAGLPVQLVVGPGDEGVGPVLARGLRECRQDLVVRADADDISLPHRCATQVSWMARHPLTVVLGSVISEFRDTPAILVSKRIVPVESGRIAVEARSRNPLNHPSVIFRRQAILEIGNYRSRPGFEDYDLWLRILMSHGPLALANLPESLVFARVGEAHLARRHGYEYALSEGRFFWSCGKEGLLSWGSVLKALAVRLPLRMLPKASLAWVMQAATRQKGN